MISLDIVFDINLYQPTWDAEVATGEAVLRAVRLAQHAGAERLAANLYELDPGAIVSPLHFHHANEELLFVISGTPSLRRGPDDERVLERGEVVAFPVGPEGACSSAPPTSCPRSPSRSRTTPWRSSRRAAFNS
jgi:uncharacterized cupin superfamily protein